MKRVSWVMAMVFVVVLSGCLADKGELNEAPPQTFCDSLNATYNDTMKTIIDVRCAFVSGCHGSQSFNGDFTSYASMQATGVLDSSIIGARLFSSEISFVMPQGNPLPDSVKVIFECWIRGGFPQQ